MRVEAIANHESIGIVQNLVEAIDPERDSLAASPRVSPMRLVALAAPRLRRLLEQPTAAARLRYFLVLPASLVLKLGAQQKAIEAPNEAPKADSPPDKTKKSASLKSRSVTRINSTIIKMLTYNESKSIGVSSSTCKEHYSE